jgi:ABC-type Co2+ transport system permease subunit
MSGDLPVLIAPIASLVMGLVALVFPDTFARQTGLAADGPLGRSELRAVFGGVFIGIGLACVLLGSAAAHVVGAAAFLGGATAKLLSAVLERGVLPAALPGLLVDLLLGALFVWGASGLARR